MDLIRSMIIFSVGKDSTCSAGDTWGGFNLWWGRSLGGGKWQPIPVFLKNPKDRGAWRATVREVTVRYNWATKHTRDNTGASQVAPVVKNPPVSEGVIGDASLIPGSGRSPGGEHGNLIQYSCLENPKDRRACRLQYTGSQIQIRLKWFSIAHSTWEYYHYL